MKDNYRIPAQARIGHVHLKVASIQRSLDFYSGLLGCDFITEYGDHHIGLNTWHSKDAPPARKEGVGLYHTAILYPTRKDLAHIYARLKDARYPLTGASDHGVSEALYLNDPDGNGVELYWDRPKEEWPKKSDGSIEMYTRALDLESLRSELN